MPIKYGRELFIWVIPPKCCWTNVKFRLTKDRKSDFWESSQQTNVHSVWAVQHYQQVSLMHSSIVNTVDFFIVLDYKMYLFIYLFIHLPGCDAVKKEHDIQALANTQPYGKHVNILKLNLQFNLPSLLWSLNWSICF